MNKETLESAADAFEPHRGRLFGLAYRMLGSPAEAEDVVQEAYVPWHQSDRTAIRNSEAWLVTTAMRLAIDRLRALKTECDAYSGPWLPEPMMHDMPPPPDRCLELASDLWFGFLMLLNLAGIFGASLAPYAATYLAKTYGLQYVGYYLTLAAGLTIVGLLAARETKDDDLTRTAQAQQAEFGIDRAVRSSVPPVLDPNRNCCPLAKADRFALLIDGSNYYGTLARAISQAKQTVAILGWDLDSRARLGPGAPPGELVPPLWEFLPAVADANPDLNIYILTWDFPILLANVRDPKLVWGRDPFNHPRVHLKFDSTHPPGASHHQKIVVIDDGLAFAGGMDIAGGRWDSPEHLACDARRPGKDGPYPPYHDVMAMVDGGAARALAGIVRDRWRRSTGTSIPDSVQDRDLWPDCVTPDLVDVSIGISRTDFDTDGSGGCREIEELHLNLIAAAREFIYIENQYLTSATIVNALCRRLETADGPEVLIVLPLKNTGWLEEHTIEVMRFRSVRLLRQADRFDRLRITYPVVPDLADTAIGVHAKVLIADDRLLRVGSSNLTNRSMRLDTECDLTIEAAGPSERLAISGLRNRLLAEHLGMSSEAVVSFLAKDASLVRLVDSRRASARCLLDLPVEDRLSEPIVEDELVDPSKPITTGLVLEALATSSTHHLVKRVLPLAVVCVAMTAVAVLCWRTIRARSRPLRR